MAAAAFFMEGGAGGFWIANFGLRISSAAMLAIRNPKSAI